MSKKKDLFNLGEAYADVLNKVITEDSVPSGEVGSAPLVNGGPEEKGGFRPPLVDITKMSDKDKKDNIYNIKGYTYGDGNAPGFGTDQPDPTGPEFDQVPYSGVVGPEEDEETEEEKREARDRKKPGGSNVGDYDNVSKDDFCGPAGGAPEGSYPVNSEKRARAALSYAHNAPNPEGIKNCVYKKAEEHGWFDRPEEDEEILGEHEKIARDGLNNFMSKTSVFDKLYNKVMVNENFGEDAEDVTELEALGIETETDVEVDEVPEEITVAIPGELAQSLCDILQTALAQQETEVEVDVDVTDVTDTEFEEDEEAQMKDGGGYGVDAGSTLSKEVNYGKKNKVGKLHPAGGAVQKTGGGYGVDAGSTLNHTVDHALKNNKVGNTKLGSIPGA
jgi:hypothetical protein|tara:strand:- start:3706 stop:4875 length:1170 start_codon:yes stop_codon:yes gene_type:complete